MTPSARKSSSVGTTHVHTYSQSKKSRFRRCNCNNAPEIVDAGTTRGCRLRKQNYGLCRGAALAAVFPSIQTHSRLWNRCLNLVRSRVAISLQAAARGLCIVLSAHLQSHHVGRLLERCAVLSQGERPAYLQVVSRIKVVRSLCALERYPLVGLPKSCAFAVGVPIRQVQLIGIARP